MDKELLMCACSSAEHQIIISVYDDDNDKDKTVYCTIHLAKHSFFERLVQGIKYIFGYRCKYGDFDEFLFKPEHKDTIKKIYDYLNEDESDNSKK